MMKFIKILIILPVLVYGGLKGYIWYSVKSSMDDIVAMAAPFAEVSYGSVISSLEGKVGIEDLVIRPKMNNDVFTAQEMSVSASNILDIIFIGRSAKNKEFPEYAVLDFKKIDIDLNSKSFDMLSQMQTQAAMQQPKRAPLLIERIDALGCGDVVKFGPKEFVNMGYNPLELDLTMKMDFQKAAQIMKLEIHFKDRDLYDVNLALQFPFNPDKFKSGAAANSRQAFSKMNVKYTDNGYYKLRNRYCAKKNGGTIEQYADANVSLLKARLGASFPWKAVESYRNFLMGGGIVKVGMNPAEPVMLSNLSLYKNSDVLDVLGLDITINGDAIDDKAIVWNESQPIEKKSEEANLSTEKQDVKPIDSIPADSPSPTPTPVLASAPVSDNATATPKEKSTETLKEKATLKETAKTITKTKVKVKAKAKTEPVPKKFDYRTVKKTQLSKYIDRKIEVEISEDKNYQGVLESVARDRIWIRMRMTGGEYSFPIKLAEIKDVKIYLYM